jgi:tetratricopeptide (TPR) repeat protein
VAGIPAKGIDRVKAPRPCLVLVLLLVGVFSLGTMLHIRALNWRTNTTSGSMLARLLGESRRLFANHFFVKADISFHSGYYPSLFDQARQAQERQKAMVHEGVHREGEDEDEGDFLKPPKDWIDRFSRNFRITEHSHLEGEKAREMLPWLKISAELDPKRVETYVVAAYWLRRSLGKSDEAEQFLREGLRANPDSYELLFELGRVINEDRHDPARARNILELAARRWHESEDKKKDPDTKMLHNIATELAAMEQKEGNSAKAIEWLEVAKPLSPHPDALQLQIDALRAKLTTPEPKKE